jgi:alpha-D-ribose 1-methylphosphonate 5-triphosphate synthase subunit PhnG
MQKLTGPREALRQAIDSAGSAEAHVLGLRASIERIEGQLYDARRRIREARAASKLEEQSQVRALVDGAEVVELVRKARTAEAESEETVRACQAAIVVCRNELGEAESALYLAERGVQRAAARVVEAEALDGLLSAVTRAHAELAAKTAILTFIRLRLDNETGRKIDRALAAPEEVRGEHSAVEPWRVCWESLLQTADGALP